jgi:hypothetical protein
MVSRYRHDLDRQVQYDCGNDHPGTALTKNHGTIASCKERITWLYPTYEDVELVSRSFPHQRPGSLNLMP